MFKTFVYLLSGHTSYLKAVHDGIRRAQFEFKRYETDYSAFCSGFSEFSVSRDTPIYENKEKRTFQFARQARHLKIQKKHPVHFIVDHKAQYFVITI
jgi:hypothetical protein